jgi:PIN domain nuclease of toxin-antitoxin system
MKFLLDTSCLIFADQAPANLGAKARSILTDSKNELFVSAVSAWEIAIKQSIGKLSPNINPQSAVDKLGAQWVAATDSVYSTLIDLPLHHHDPFDRLLISQAIMEGYTLITSDRQFTHYSVPVIW